MKRFAYIYIAPLAMALSLAACSSKSDDLTSSVLDIYEHYADHSENLTVAFLGDYERNGRTYNAVMFRAEDDEQWEWLKNEFGIVTPQDLALMGDSLRGTHHGVIITPATIPPEVVMRGEEAKQQYIDSVSNAVMRDMLGDTARLAMAPVVVYEFKGMADSVLARKMRRQSDMDYFTHRHGDAGYILRADIPNRTLWLFFYAGDDDQAQLVRNLNPPKDKIV